MTYNKNYITAVILKNEYDACTSEELEVLNNWYNTLDESAPEEKIKTINKNSIKQASWESIAKLINEDQIEEQKDVFQPSRSLSYYLTRVAAILILIAGSYITYTALNKSRPPVQNIPQYVSLTNSSGRPEKIILPDNSLLWLDANSSIKYQDNFAQVRNITLIDGKVFFNVSHDKSKPFTVETENGLKTTVLGTAFLMEKKPGNANVKIGVLRGKVQVTDNVTKFATLEKNQGVSVNTSSKTASFLIMDSLEMTGWFNGKIVLENVTLKEVAASIKKNFSYRLEFSSPKLLLKPCSITYNSTDNIEDILFLLGKIYHFTNTISDSVIYIKPIKGKR